MVGVVGSSPIAPTNDISDVERQDRTDMVMTPLTCTETL